MRILPKRDRIVQKHDLSFVLGTLDFAKINRAWIRSEPERGSVGSTHKGLILNWRGPDATAFRF